MSKDGGGDGSKDLGLICYKLQQLLFLVNLFLDNLMFVFNLIDFVMFENGRAVGYCSTPPVFTVLCELGANTGGHGLAPVRKWNHKNAIWKWGHHIPFDNKLSTGRIFNFPLPYTSGLFPHWYVSNFLQHFPTGTQVLPTQFLTDTHVQFCSSWVEQLNFSQNIKH